MRSAAVGLAFDGDVHRGRSFRRARTARIDWLCGRDSIPNACFGPLLWHADNGPLAIVPTGRKNPRQPKYPRPAHAEFLETAVRDRRGRCNALIVLHVPLTRRHPSDILRWLL